MEWAPHAVRKGRGARVSICAHGWPRPACRWPREHMHARPCQQPDTHRSASPVQNPYVRMLVGQTELQALQRADRSSGYPCLDQPVIVACRPLLTRGGGIQSSGICLQLPDPCHQDCRAGLDALGCVQRQQGVERVLDLLCRHAVADKLLQILVVQNRHVVFFF